MQKPSWIKNGGGKYCSKTCHYQGLKTGKIMTCFICNKKLINLQKYYANQKARNIFAVNRAKQNGEILYL